MSMTLDGLERDVKALEREVDSNAVFASIGLIGLLATGIMWGVASLKDHRVLSRRIEALESKWAQPCVIAPDAPIERPADEGRSKR
jgi:hypothetical protein